MAAIDGGEDEGAKRGAGSDAARLGLRIAHLAPRLRRFALSLCGDPHDADDIVQTACVKALSRIEQFEPGSNLESWMVRIVQTTFLDEMRRRKRSAPNCPAETLDAVCDQGLGARRADGRLMLSAVGERIAELPSAQRAALTLVVFEGLSYREAAERLSTKVGTVMSRLSRARAALAEGVTAA
ncbi:MAG: RNA polymerase sigma factor [Pseudomonadota bacterium]